MHQPPAISSGTNRIRPANAKHIDRLQLAGTRHSMNPIAVSNSFVHSAAVNLGEGYLLENEDRMPDNDQRRCARNVTLSEAMSDLWDQTSPQRFLITSVSGRRRVGHFPYNLGSSPNQLPQNEVE